MSNSNDSFFDLDLLWQVVMSSHASDASVPTGWTQECPSLARFPVAMTTSWKPVEREHVSDCAYCRKIVAKQWQYTPPSYWALGQYKAGTSPDRLAMELFLTTEEGASAKRDIDHSPIVAAIALGNEGGRWLSKQFSVAMPKGRFARVGGFAGRQPAIHVDGVCSDPRLKASLSERDHQLIIRVQTEDTSLAGKCVKVDLLTSSEAVTFQDLTLQDRGDFGAIAQKNIGRRDRGKPADRFECELLVDWLDEPPPSGDKS